MAGDSKSSKFTRGEKCIFIHLLSTFVLITGSVIIYVVHLCLIKHPGNSYLSTRRVSQLSPDVKGVVVPDYMLIGVLYINISNIRAVCSTIHIRDKWSISPAHCIVIRTDPNMAQWLSKWGIKYRALDFKFIVTEIKRSFVHPHFNRDDFSNNIGLLEHTTSVPIHQHLSFNKSVKNNNHIRFEESNLRLAEWTVAENKDTLKSDLKFYFVSSMERTKCNNYMTPAVDLRSYEYCVFLQDGINISLHHGSALLQEDDLTGFFSWGERREKTLPLIVLHIANFKEWLQDTITL